MIRIYIMIAVAGIVFGGVRYFLHMQDQMKQMAANNAKLEMVAEENEIMMNNMIAETQRMNELNDDLRNRLDAAKQYQNDLIAKLKKHDLSKLSYAKPGLIEKRINNGTQKLFDELESISGGTVHSDID